MVKLKWDSPIFRLLRPSTLLAPRGLESSREESSLQLVAWIGTVTDENLAKRVLRLSLDAHSFAPAVPFEVIRIDLVILNASLEDEVIPSRGT